MMMEKLGELKSRVLKSVSYDSELVRRELSSGSLITGDARKDIEQIVDGLEKSVSFKK